MARRDTVSSCLPGPGGPAPQLPPASTSHMGACGGNAGGLGVACPRQSEGRAPWQPWPWGAMCTLWTVPLVGAVPLEVGSEQRAQHRGRNAPRLSMESTEGVQKVPDGRDLLPSPLPFQSLNTPKGQYSCKQHPSLQSHALCQSQGRGQGPRKGLCWAERGPLWVSGELPGQLEEKPLDSWQAGPALLHSPSSQTRSRPPRTTSCPTPRLQAGHPSTVTPGQLQPELPWKPRG